MSAPSESDKPISTETSSSLPFFAIKISSSSKLEKSKIFSSSETSIKYKLTEEYIFSSLPTVIFARPKSFSLNCIDALRRYAPSSGTIKSKDILPLFKVTVYSLSSSIAGLSAAKAIIEIENIITIASVMLSNFFIAGLLFTVFWEQYRLPNLFITKN